MAKNDDRYEQANQIKSIIYYMFICGIYHEEFSMDEIEKMQITGH